MRDVYKLITDRIVESLDRGTVPWHRPWGGPERAPRSLASGKPYRGINVFLLTSAGYESPYWLTYRQAAGREGYVRKGERGTPCIYWNWVERKDREAGESGKPERYAFLKSYTVFNVQQCEKIDFPAVESPERAFSPIEVCELVVSGMPRAPQIQYGRSAASYRPTTDQIEMPSRETFENEEAFYATLFHELIHSTGHRTRLDRPEITEPVIFGSRSYSKEELIAEMGAAFLCGHTGIENAVIENSASYINGWLRKLRSDSRLAVAAAGKAQKAADYVLDRPEQSEARD